jgi:hypothetical protein
MVDLGKRVRRAAGGMAGLTRLAKARVLSLGRGLNVLNVRMRHGGHLPFLASDENHDAPRARRILRKPACMRWQSPLKRSEACS